MSRTCDWTFNRNELLTSGVAVCFYCFKEFLPNEITEWFDEEQNSSQTAICPYCGIDAVVGFNGTVDHQWVKERHQKSFGSA